MSDLLMPDSDGDVGTETLQSSQSSLSSESSIGRFSFDAIEILAKSLHSTFPEKTCSFKPHRSSDIGWEAIRSASMRRKAGVSFRDFKIIRRIGSGDIGTVYLCRLADICGNEWRYAMKMVDKEALLLKKKAERAETEKRILRMLDHPFLPTLYTEFEASNISCVVMDYCSGGDLHILRHKLRGKRFPLNSARFYAAEVLLALEYLHMLGIIYRDLKPENVLVRSDGHIMLSDFDLSLQSEAKLSVDLPRTEAADPGPATSDDDGCCSIPCLPFALLRPCMAKKRPPPRPAAPQLVVEPVDARSCSFVGTHEYVSPEVASGGTHGNAVDWWSFGVFLYELIYGRTPFAGKSNELTLRNILKKPLIFPAPAESVLESLARDLISALLAKDPERRLGARRGAAEVKAHPFFRGMNFPLIRSCQPPDVPGLSPRWSSRHERKMSSHFDFF